MTIPEETPKWCFLILDKHDGEPIEHLSWQGYQKLIKGLKKRCVCTEEQHLKRGIPKNLSTCYVNQDLNYFADKLFKKVYGWTTYFCHWTHPNVMHPSHKSLQACCNDRFEYQYWKFGVGIPEGWFSIDYIAILNDDHVN